MGLNIREIIPRREIEISQLKGKTVCVDAFNSLYQFLSSVRQADGTPLMDDKGNVTSHLSGIFYRNLTLLEQGIKLVYVFDGDAPDLKVKTHKKRKSARDLASERYEEARQDEDLVKMKSYSSKLLRLDDNMIKESKELLKAMGIMVVQAPSEGEAEAAYLCKENREVYASVSQDYDSLLFGASRLIRNLTLARRRKTYSGYVEVKPEEIILKDVLKKLEINLEQLICLGIIVGTDYNPKGIPRLGQKKALKLVQEYGIPEEIFGVLEEKIADLEEEDRFDWKEIFNLFENHEVKDVDFKFPKIDGNKIKEILVFRHNFSEERVEKQLKRLEKLEHEKKQNSLSKWF
ncbi:MAG: flap endonuclease-1 [Candidatus Pacearchaeota archaeon]|nr:flap endonuclease-1 [Candidatus Pacearchaeota archaeon]